MKVGSKHRQFQTHVFGVASTSHHATTVCCNKEAASSSREPTERHWPHRQTPATINYKLIYNFKYQFATIRKLSVHNSPHDFFGHHPHQHRGNRLGQRMKLQQELRCNLLHCLLFRDKSCRYTSEPVVFGTPRGTGSTRLECGESNL